jgi:hypothetical protein
MNTVASLDGTKIACDREDAGPAVILVSGVDGQETGETDLP